MDENVSKAVDRVEQTLRTVQDSLADFQPGDPQRVDVVLSGIMTLLGFMYIEQVKHNAKNL